ncbi:MAG: Gfo/Idh/MocA family oxidoreductase [Alphaproteobacteria bacterium]|nr:MAG: Gfo/Idh/MocA family oxidoreductase [Alphaproteobacteria bacterium]
MVGGGEGAFIGGVHRMAARLDGHWDLVAGNFQSDPAKSVVFGKTMGLADDRCYGDFRAMAEAEAKRADRIDAVSVVTPNSTHHAIAKAFLEAGIPVICDKPMTISQRHADDLAETVKRTGLPFVLTHNYSGYAMIRQARAMVEAGELGAIRVVQVEYAQDWLARELPGNKQAEWRGDPAKAGPGGALGDIATHAFQLAEFVTGLRAETIAADLSTFVQGRKVDDNVNVMLRFGGAVRGMLWASQVATGSGNCLKLRVFGDKGGIEWAQETPETLLFTPIGEQQRIVRRGGAGVSASATHATRIPGGHPEGYLEGFAQIYADAAELVRAWQDKREPHAFAKLAPGIADGLRGVRFIEAAVASSGNNGAWTKV